MAFEEDLSVFFDTDEFADWVTFAGHPQVAGIFEKSFVRSLPGIGMEESSPAIKLPNGSVPSDVIGLSVTVLGVTYVAAAKEPDVRPGITVIFLEAA